VKEDGLPHHPHIRLVIWFRAYTRMELRATERKMKRKVEEMSRKRERTANYKLVQIEVKIHEHRFKFRVTVGDVVGMYDNTCF
jgi:hypothetical protein